MANSGNAEHGRSVVARWRMLAERRLQYLIELYETGRWRVYYKEPEFLKVIQEARVALATWEQLAPPDPVQDKPVSEQTPVVFHKITDKGNSAAVDLIKINLNI